MAITSPLYLILNNNYTSVHIALFKGSQFIDSRQEDNKRSSKNLILLIDTLLSSYGDTLNNCDFIAVNQGPGPFTTLRVVLSSANGLAFARKLPLIGIDGLDAFLQEYSNLGYDYTIVLLNAFSNDVYFALQNNKAGKTIKNWSPIEKFTKDYLQPLPLEASIQFMGNGVDLHFPKLQPYLTTHRVIQNPNPATCSVASIAKLALERWNNQQGLTHQLLPLYLNEYSTLTKPSVVNQEL
ncbi:MAG TPA: tRNA (adenosine(37)-N6)-threonylcarbamoyltransferase complex dimerization subunit type 1 TsaB [Candidatus Babeliaceae bacterium]|nr:tRNA (adenosine(37)-N6)-threonylcarbamoyltransferase complex dimerization subunit type 1 TsaB [Candidatus Babeliaceae bacterium]